MLLTWNILFSLDDLSDASTAKLLAMRSSASVLFRTYFGKRRRPKRAA